MVSGTVGFNRQFRKQTPLNYASQRTRMKPRAAQRGVLLRPVRHKNKINEDIVLTNGTPCRIFQP